MPERHIKAMAFLSFHIHDSFAFLLDFRFIKSYDHVLFFL